LATYGEAVTLSKVTVLSTPSLWLHTGSPIYTLAVIVMVVELTVVQMA